jgi:gamma-glutamyltranspeptidase/glutathione hydrolase
LRKNDYNRFSRPIEAVVFGSRLFCRKIENSDIVCVMKQRLVALLVVFAFAANSLGGFSHVRSQPSARRDATVASHGMVASQHPIASQIGVNVLKKGGNAVDAAIAVGLALSVVYPEAGNIGGGGFMLIRKADGTFTSIDYREMAPAAASRDVYIDKNGQVIKGEGSSTVGYRASGVPGTVAGFEMAFKKYGSGRIKWADLVEPARAAAANGYELTYRLANLFQDYKQTLSKYPESDRIFLRNGNYYQAGEILRQPELARTLGRIKLQGAKDFYLGETARMIAADMGANGGLITREDLRNYKAKERPPLHGNYRGYEVVTMPPPSSGGIVLLQILNMLEGYNMRALGSNSAARYHLYTEASRRAFADRAEYMADPDFANVPVDRLIDKKYAETRRSSINSQKADTSASIKPGDLGPQARVGTSEDLSYKEGNETTHFTVVDKDGMVVSNTYTINDLYGSRVTIKGAGFFMNDEMDDFAAQPGKPNLFGLVQGERNKVEGGKRPLSSMTPTIVLDREGKFWFAVGARGGPRIISAVTQIVLNVIDNEMDLQAALAAPRVHHQWLPDEIAFEQYGMSPDTRNILASYGHQFAPRAGGVASATAIMRIASRQGSNAQPGATDGGPTSSRSSMLMGVIDPRSDGAAIGY